MNMHESSLRDAEAALKTDNCCRTSYMLQAEALIHLNQPAKAAAAVMTGLLYDPQNHAMRALLARANALRQTTATAAAAATANEDAHEGTTAAAAPSNVECNDGAAGDGTSDDDECVITGEQCVVTNRDYPHGRHGCFTCKFKIGAASNQLRCPQCYCYVCDAPAAECDDWDNNHMHAHPGEQKWQDERVSCRNGTTNAIGLQIARIRQVYPSHANAALTKPLKPVQQQMLAFMLDVERKGAPTTALTLPVKSVKRQQAAQAAGHVDPILPAKVFGGILAAQMGLGKTAVAIGLLQCHPMFTLFVVRNGTVTQWMSEFQTFAPTLRVARLYGDQQAPVLARVRQLDALVVGHTSKLLPEFEPHVRRIVVDESHLVLGTHASSQILSFLRSRCTVAVHRWCLSGTPASSIDRDDFVLNKQLNFVAGTTVYLRDYVSVASLKAIILRIERKQKIADADGNLALASAVPDVQFGKLAYDLTPAARRLYDIAACCDRRDTNGCLGASDNEIIDTLRGRMRLRSMVLDGHYDALALSLSNQLDNVTCSDTTDASEWMRTTRGLSSEQERLIKELRTTNTGMCRIVVDKIVQYHAENPAYKAVIVSLSDDAFATINGDRRLHGKVGNIKRATGKASYAEQRVLDDFQKGKYLVLVASWEEMKVGINLDLANEIFFLNSTLHDAQHQQACARIARLETTHSELRATFCCARDTIHDGIYEFFEARRAGKSIAESAKAFDNDYSQAHDFGDQKTTTRVTGFDKLCNPIPVVDSYDLDLGGMLLATECYIQLDKPVLAADQADALRITLPGGQTVDVFRSFDQLTPHPRFAINEFKMMEFHKLLCSDRTYDFFNVFSRIQTVCDEEATTFHLLMPDSTLLPLVVNMRVCKFAYRSCARCTHRAVDKPPKHSIAFGSLQSKGSPEFEARADVDGALRDAPSYDPMTAPKTVTRYPSAAEKLQLRNVEAPVCLSMKMSDVIQAHKRAKRSADHTFGNSSAADAADVE